MTKTYLEFLYPGFFSDKGAPQEINHRDPSKIQITDGACGFRFYEREVVWLNGEELIGNIKNTSGWYYRGTKLDIQGVEKLNTTGQYDILLSNMKCNNWPNVVQLETGYVYPLHDDDVVLE
jgi:hypothetical protein